MKKLTLLTVFICAVLFVHAQSSNDDCSNAITLTVGADAEIGSIVTINSNTGEPATTTGTGAGGRSCWAFPNDDGVWYVFKAAATAIDLHLGDNNATYAPMAGIYDGGSGTSPVCPTNTSTMLQCLNYTTGSSALSITGLTVNNWYYILVDMPSTISQTFEIQLLLPQYNIDCNSATMLYIDSASVIGAIGNNTSSSFPSCWNASTCAGGGSSNILNPSWYTFTVADTSVILIEVESGTLPYPVNMVLYSGTCSTLVEEKCAASTISTPINSLSTYLYPGTYYLMVDGFCSTKGTYSVKVINDPSLSGSIDVYWAVNQYNAARVFPSDSVCGVKVDQPSNNSTYSTIKADDIINDDPTPSCWTTGSNKCAQWYVFNATATSVEVRPMSYYFSGKVIWENGTMSGGADLALFSGNPGSLTQIGCTTNVTINGGVYPVSGLTVGQDYYVMMDNAGIIDSCTYGSLCVKSSVSSVSAAQDLCTNAMPLVLDVPVVNQNSYNMTPDGTLCSGSTENNVWYKLTAPTAGTYFVHFDNLQCNGYKGIQTSIFSSLTCPPTTTNCVQYTNYALIRGIYHEFTMNTGETLLLDVDGWGGTLCKWTITFTQTRPTDTPLINYKEMKAVQNVFYNKETDELLIQINDPKEELRISLHDITGKQLITVSSNQEQIKIPMSKIPQGMYIVTIDGDNEVYKGKIVK